MSDNKTWTKATEVASEWDGLSLVIDTNEYAGNFECDMLKACTGVSDDPYGEEDDDESDEDPPVKAVKEKVYDDLVGSIVNDHGDDSIHRACVCIYPSPGGGKKAEYNSVRIPLEKMPTPKQIADIKRRALAFAALKAGYKSPFKILAFRFIRESVTTQSVPA